jgi:alkylation response protein AidB-like acyl-CoA dehydrogenase
LHDRADGRDIKVFWFFSAEKNMLSVVLPQGQAMFALTEDHRAIQDMARIFTAKEIAPFAVEWDQRHHFAIDVVKRAAELGLCGIYVKEDGGGSGLSRLDAVIVMEALAEGCPSTAAYISIHNMVAGMIDRFAAPDLRAEILPGLCSAGLLGSYCLTEPGSGSDAAALRSRAVRDGDHYILDGTKQFISGAGAAQVYIVMARTGGAGASGISAFVVEDGTPGLSFGADERKMGWHTQPTRQVLLDNCRIPARNLLGEEGMGFKIAMTGLDGGRINIAACSLGGAQSALDKSLAYMSERKAFGARLDEFQALQFRLADMATSLEVARTFLWRAASALDAGDPGAGKLCAMAKRFVTDTGFEVANQALQLHGGYGYLAEYGVEKIVRDLRVHQILEGTNEIMRVIIARALVGGKR